MRGRKVLKCEMCNDTKEIELKESMGGCKTSPCTHCQDIPTVKEAMALMAKFKRACKNMGIDDN